MSSKSAEKHWRYQDGEFCAERRSQQFSRPPVFELVLAEGNERLSSRQSLGLGQVSSLKSGGFLKMSQWKYELALQCWTRDCKVDGSCLGRRLR